MKSYFNYFKLRLFVTLEYRLDMLAGIVTQSFFALVFIMLYEAIYLSNNNGFPMNFDSLITYVWLQQAFYSLSFPVLRDKEMIKMIKEGNICYELVRPNNFYLKFYIKLLATRLINVSIKMLPIIIIGFLMPKPYKMILPSSSTNFYIFIASLIICLFLSTAINYLVHLSVMYTMDEKGSINLINVLGQFLAGSYIPIPFFPNLLKKIAYLFPFHYLADFPYRIYTGEISTLNGYSLLINSGLTTIVLIIIGYLITKYSLKKVVIQGG